jgi:3-oxoadipate enol-lactonase
LKMEPDAEINRGNSGNARAQDGCRLFYRIHPQPGKPRIVLIHSLALDTSFWNGVVRNLSRDFEILTYDCRGHGQSERRAGAYTTRLFADDLAAILDDCAWSAATVAGCSMGGCVTQAFAAAYPKRAQALGLIDTTAWYGPTAPADWGQRAAKAAESGFPGMIGFQATRWFSEKFCAEHPDLVEATKQVFLANDMACYQAACKMMGELDLRSSLGSFRMPVSVIVGEEDYATPLAMSQSLHAALPGSSLHVIPGGRHLTPIQCPSEIAGFLRDLMGKATTESHS